MEAKVDAAVKHDYCALYEQGSGLTTKADVNNFCTFVCECDQKNPAKDDCKCK